jgi:hypothetical protein
VHRVTRGDVNVNRRTIHDKQLVENLVAHALRDDGALILCSVQLNDELMMRERERWEGGSGGEGEGK